MQEMAVINGKSRVNVEYGPLQTSLSSDETHASTTVSSRKKKVLKRAGAVNFDDEESGGDEESGPQYNYSSPHGSANNIYSENPAR